MNEAYLVTLNLSRNEKTIEHIRSLLSTVRNITIDDEYGIVLISDKRDLYAVRVIGEVNTNELKLIKTEIKEVYGVSLDSRVSSFC